jgi:hypothetical protein
LAQSGKDATAAKKHLKPCDKLKKTSRLLLTLRHYDAGNGRPMRDAAIFIGLQLLMWETVGLWSMWEHWFALFAQVNSLLMATVGCVFGVGVIIAGWCAKAHCQKLNLLLLSISSAS